MKLLPNKNLKFARTIIFISSLLILVCFLIIISLYSLHKKQEELANKYIHLNEKVLGISTDSSQVKIDFSQQIANGSPYVFGGASSPAIENQDAWDLVAKAGVTSIRRDFFIETEVPSNTTIENYKNNVNNVQNINNWNWSKGWNNINVVNNIFKNAKERNMKSFAILTYAPSWLTYSGTSRGVPKDWEIYKDIVRKIYRIHRPYIDAIEIWNEPDYKYFLDLTNSPYKTREDAYRDIYINASEAINQVNNEIKDGKKISIIANTSYLPSNTSILENLLKSAISKDIKAISYHNYDIPEPSVSLYRNIISKYNRQDLPIFITEWNYSSNEKLTNPYQTGNLALAYTAKKLIGFLKSGIEGANYFALNRNEPNKVGEYQSVFGMYRLNNTGKAYLLPQSKSWQLLSNSMGLGKGYSKIYLSTIPENLESIAFVNSNNEIGISIVNDSNQDKIISLPLDPFKISIGYKINLYAASSEFDGTDSCTIDLTRTTIGQFLKLELKSQSLIGITFTKPALSLKTLFNNILGATTSKTCSILK